MVPPSYDPFPKYLQIREIVLRWLGSLEVGTKLPTEETLSKQFGVSRVTVRQSLQTLERDGIISRQAGVGTWLARRIGTPADERLTGPIEDFSGLGLPTSAILIRQQAIEATAEIAAALKVRAGRKVYEIRRLRILGDDPILLLDAYFPLGIGRKIARRDVGTGLFVPILRKICGAGIWEEYQKIEAVAASKPVSAMLKVAPGFPVLVVNRAFVDAAGKPVVYFKTLFRADRYYYTVKLRQPRMPEERGLHPRNGGG